MSRTRRSNDLETHRAVFTWILQVLATAAPAKSLLIRTRFGVGTPRSLQGTWRRFWRL